MATSFVTFDAYLYKRGFGRFSNTHIKIKKQPLAKMPEAVVN